MAPLCHPLNCYNTKSYLQSILSILWLWTAISDKPEQEICPQMCGICVHCAMNTTGSSRAGEDKGKDYPKTGQFSRPVLSFQRPHSPTDSSCDVCFVPARAFVLQWTPKLTVFVNPPLHFQSNILQKRKNSTVKLPPSIKMAPHLAFSSHCLLYPERSLRSP